MRRIESPRLIGLGGLRQVITELATVQITATRDRLVNRFAPEAIFFAATTSGFELDAPAGANGYDPEFHRIHYEWDFGDAMPAWTAPQKVPDAFRSASTGYGKQSAHLFLNHGTFTVTCRARQIIQLVPFVVVKQAVSSIDITIEENPHNSDDSATVVVSAAAAADPDPANWTGWSSAPSHAYRAWNNTNPGNNNTNISTGSLQSILRRLVQIDGKRAVRVLFWSGDAYLDTRSVSFAGKVLERPVAGLPAGDFGRIDVGSWGGGKATITQFAGGHNGVRRGWAYVFNGVIIRGNHDSVSQTTVSGTGTASWGSSLRLAGGGGWTVLNDVDFRNNTIAIYPTRATNTLPDNSNTPHTILANNCTLFDSGDYWMLYDGNSNSAADWGMSHIAFLGCDLDRHPQARSNGDGKDGNKNRHSPMFRGNHGFHLIAQGTYHMSRFGWTSEGAWLDGVQRAAVQPHIRIVQGDEERHSSPSPDYQMPTIQVHQCVFDGDSWTAFTCRSLSGNAEPGLAAFHVDGNIFLTATGGTILNTETGNVTVSNNLLIRPSLSALQGPSNNEGLVTSSIESGKLEPNTLATEAQVYANPIRVFNNTGVILCPQEDLASGYSTAALQWGEEENNILYAPSWTTEVGQVDPTTLGTLDTTILFESGYLGPVEDAHFPTQQTQWRFPLGEVSLYRPQSAPAATGILASVTDLLGETRDGQATAGALLPQGL